MSFNSGDFVLNPKTNRLIKKNGALHLRILKEKLMKKESKKKVYTLQSETDTDTDMKPVRKPRKRAPKKVIPNFNNISDMSDSELSEMESYIQKRLSKTKIVEPIEETTNAEESEESSESSE